MTFEPIDLGHPDANMTVNAARALLDDQAPAWWFLAYVDIGIACFVWATNGLTAIVEANRLGIHKDSHVRYWGPLEDENIDFVPDSIFNRTLRRPEICWFDVHLPDGFWVQRGPCTCCHE